MLSCLNAIRPPIDDGDEQPDHQEAAVDGKGDEAIHSDRSFQ